MQLARSFLLEPAGDEGRDRIPFLFFSFDRVNDKLFPLNSRDDALGIGLCRNRRVLPIDAVQLGFEWRGVGASQRHRNRPILLRAKGFPLLFTFANQSHRHGLHPAHAESTTHLGPQQLAALISRQSDQAPGEPAAHSPASYRPAQATAVRA